MSVIDKQSLPADVAPSGRKTTWGLSRDGIDGLTSSSLSAVSPLFGTGSGFQRKGNFSRISNRTRPDATGALRDERQLELADSRAKHQTELAMLIDRVWISRATSLSLLPDHLPLSVKDLELDFKA